MIFSIYESAFCGRNILSHEFDANQPNKLDSQKSDDNKFLVDAGKLLQRNKRYLLWTNGGIAKVTAIFFFKVQYFKI